MSKAADELIEEERLEVRRETVLRIIEIGKLSFEEVKAVAEGVSVKK